MNGGPGEQGSDEQETGLARSIPERNQGKRGEDQSYG
jgi:hypothetical protein